MLIYIVKGSSILSVWKASGPLRQNRLEATHEAEPTVSATARIRKGFLGCRKVE
jgi:hypothetical protein